MDVLRENLKNAEIKKNQQQIKADLDSIPNSELSVLRCVCGSCEWKSITLLYVIPLLHPKNGTGEKLNRPQSVCICGKCGKANPDHLDVNDSNYIDNLPEELKPMPIVHTSGYVNI